MWGRSRRETQKERERESDKREGRVTSIKCPRGGQRDGSRKEEVTGFRQEEATECSQWNGWGGKPSSVVDSGMRKRGGNRGGGRNEAFGEERLEVT